MKIKVEFRLRDMTTAEIAAGYGRSERSMRDWLRKYRHIIGEKEGDWYNVKQVIKIIELRGPMGAVMIEEEEI